MPFLLQLSFHQHHFTQKQITIFLSSVFRKLFIFFRTIKERHLEFTKFVSLDVSMRETVFWTVESR